MAKFHINSNGEVKFCTASVNACQFGDETLHFVTAESADRTIQEILSKNYSSKILLGKKTSLVELLTAKKAQSAAAVKPVFEDELRSMGFVKTDAAFVPDAVDELFFRSQKRGDLMLDYYVDRRGNFVQLVMGADGIRRKLTAPPTLDIPCEMIDFNTWNMSLHPQGPKVSYICGGCRRVAQARMANFARSKFGLLISCAHCSQLNKAPFTYN